MKIVISCVDGSVHVMEIVGGANVDDCIQKWKAVHTGMYASHRSMPDSSIPIDREFRSAWSDITPQPVIDIDMQKARDIHLSRIRMKRNEMLSKLDIDAIKAQDMGDSEKLLAVRGKKQELRDLPETLRPILDAAETVEQLKEIKPFEQEVQP